MTGCLYYYIKHTPVLISDALVTEKGMNLSKMVIPGTLLKFEFPDIVKKDELIRKLYVISETIAVAASGIQDEVIAFYNDLLEYKTVFATQDNPLKAILSLTNNYSSLEALVAQSSPSGFDYYGRVTQIPPFGTCAAVGSGAAELIENTAKWSSQFKDFDLNNYSNVIYACEKLAANHVMQSLLEEFVFGRPKNWGGFIEYIIYNRAEKKWVYSKPSLYGFFTALPLGSNSFTIVRSPHFFCYDGGNEEYLSGVLGIYAHKGSFHRHQWSIKDVLFGKNKKSKDYSEWIGWKPQLAMFMIVPYGTRSKTYVTEFLAEPIQNDPGADQVEMIITEDTARFDLPETYIDDLGERVSQNWKMNYVTISCLSDDNIRKAYDLAKRGVWD